MSDDYVEWMKERNKIRFGTEEQMLAKCKAAMEQAANHAKVGCPPVQPPIIGLCHQDTAEGLFNLHRIYEILQAMILRFESVKPIPLEWVEWLKQRVESQHRGPNHS